MRREQSGSWYRMSREERQNQRRTRSPWWVYPANTLDRATAMMPALMYERLDQFGLDFAIILSTGISASLDGMPDATQRKAVARASNIMKAEMFEAYSDRMTPVATIPTNTPEEAIEEAEYAVKELGLKAAQISGSIRRPIPAYALDGANPASLPYFVDSLALDSLYDYDPMWAKFAELKLAPMTHTLSSGWVDRSSPTNFVYNIAGHFAQASHSFARAVYLGGVTSRFPTLRFGLMEGGVAWGRVLCTNLVSLWEKRNKDAMLAHLRPTNIDVAQMRELIGQYGGKWMAGRADELLDNISYGVGAEELTNRELNLDDYEAVGVHSKQEAAAEFSRSFYFGCESDDPLISLAFDQRLGPRLKPLFGSDISHFDVTDMTEVLEESYELVEHGLLDEQDFREFTFSNAVEFHAGMNPNFFRGTAVEHAVAEELVKQTTNQNSNVPS
jgi:predicted TIM-barrel fold metal-dependent hydrolase